MEKKFFKIAIITMLLVCVYATIVNAYSFSVPIVPSSTTVAEGDEFTVKFKVSNLDVGTNGINSLSGYFKFDESVFESINETNIDGLNSWKPSYNEENGKITLTKTTFVKAEEEVFQVTLRTKSGTSGKKGDINFTNVVASNSAQEIGTADVSTTINIGTTDENVANSSNTSSGNFNIIVPSTNTVNNVVNNTVNNVVNNTVNNVTNNAVSSYVNNSSSNSDIPYTGVEDTVMYVIIGLIVISAIFYIKFEKINKDMR